MLKYGISLILSIAILSFISTSESSQKSQFLNIYYTTDNVALDIFYDNNESADQLARMLDKVSEENQYKRYPVRCRFEEAVEEIIENGGVYIFAYITKEQLPAVLKGFVPKDDEFICYVHQLGDFNLENQQFKKINSVFTVIKESDVKNYEAVKNLFDFIVSVRVVI